MPDAKLLVVEELRGADGQLRALRADVLRAERVRSQHPDGSGVRALSARLLLASLECTSGAGNGRASHREDAVTQDPEGAVDVVGAEVELVQPAVEAKVLDPNCSHQRVRRRERTRVGGASAYGAR